VNQTTSGAGFAEVGPDDHDDCLIGNLDASRLARGCIQSKRTASSRASGLVRRLDWFGDSIHPEWTSPTFFSQRVPRCYSVGTLNTSRLGSVIPKFVNLQHCVQHALVCVSNLLPSRPSVKFRYRKRHEIVSMPRRFRRLG
jgi:hypothetical protein